MGRPINKRSFGPNIGSSIAIFANLGEGSKQYFIRSQSGTKKYRIQDLEDSSEAGVVTLVTKDLEDLAVGEGVIFAYEGEDVFPVVKLLQHRVSVLDNGTVRSFSWKVENNGIILLEESEE